MLTALDQVANRNHLQLIKAFLPYVQPQRQKMLSVCIKMMELQNILRFYDHGECCVSACGLSGEAPEALDILADIRSYCEAGEQQIIDQCIRLLTMLEFYSCFAEDDSDEVSAAPEEDPDFLNFGHSERIEQ